MPFTYEGQQYLVPGDVVELVFEIPADDAKAAAARKDIWAKVVQGTKDHWWVHEGSAEETRTDPTSGQSYRAFVAYVHIADPAKYGPATTPEEQVYQANLVAVLAWPVAITISALSALIIARWVTQVWSLRETRLMSQPDAGMMSDVAKQFKWPLVALAAVVVVWLLRGR
jgi:hypothetical protein